MSPLQGGIVMKRKEFERVTPESVGIPSEAVAHLIDRLETSGVTEPHGLMLMRFGKVFAEGWWAPYASGVRHGLQSHTKTYAATAVGIAYTEGILSLDERVIDIFPQHAPKEPSENLKKLTVRDVLCMGCGMDTMPAPTEHWIKDFLATPVTHVPGTTYMYNSTGSTLLGAIVREKTGLGLHDYLKPRLFDKIGIDADNLRWMTMPDGMEVGGGGLLATTEDNLRLMKLYADGGVWEGERILSEEYVELATSLQNQSASERAGNPFAEDNFVGYGFQMWMCRPNGVYRADGAMGQFTIVVPEREMILAITEFANGGTGSEMPQRVLDLFWEFLESLPPVDVRSLPENEAAACALQHKMQCLALPAPRASKLPADMHAVDGVRYRIKSGRLSFDGTEMARMMSGSKPAPTVETITLRFAPDACVLCFEQGGQASEIRIATDGTRCENRAQGLLCRLLCSGEWVSDHEFAVTMRWLEMASPKRLVFDFDGDSLHITSEQDGPFVPKLDVQAVRE